MIVKFIRHLVTIGGCTGVALWSLIQFSELPNRVFGHFVMRNRLAVHGVIIQRRVFTQMREVHRELAGTGGAKIAFRVRRQRLAALGTGVLHHCPVLGALLNRIFCSSAQEG